MLFSGLNFAPCAKRRPEKNYIQPNTHQYFTRANCDTLCVFVISISSLKGSHGGESYKEKNVCSVVRAAVTKVNFQLTAVTTVGTHHYNRTANYNACVPDKQQDASSFNTRAFLPGSNLIFLPIHPQHTKTKEPILLRILVHSVPKICHFQTKHHQFHTTRAVSID